MMTSISGNFSLLGKQFQRLPRSVKAIMEQAIQSVYSFVIVAVAGRLLIQTEFGLFSLVWSAFPVVLFLFSAVITRPLGITYPAAQKPEQDTQELFGIDIQNIFFYFSIFMFFLASGIVFFEREISNLQLIFLGLSLISIRLRYETVRRFCIVQNRLERNFLNALIMHLPSVIILPTILFFVPAELPSNILNIFIIAIYILLVLSSILIKITPSFKNELVLKNHRFVWISYFKYGKDLITAAIIETVFKRLAPYFMVIGAGVAEAGTWAIGRLLVGPALVILLGISNAALPAMRKAYASEGINELNREFKSTCLTMLGLYFIPLLLLAFYASFFIKLLIGTIYPGSEETLQVYCVAFFIMGGNTLISTYLQARGNVRQQLIASVLSSVIYLLGLLYIVPNEIGAVGIANLALVSEFATIIVYVVYMFNVIKKDKGS